MSEALATFVYKATGHQIRVAKVDESGKAWFIGPDLCHVLGHEQAGIVLRKLAAKHKGVCSVNTPGGVQKMVIVNEAGMYLLLLRSRRPEAEPFVAWVTEELLPSIRKTGSYSLPGLAAAQSRSLQPVVDAITSGLSTQATAMASLLEPQLREITSALMRLPLIHGAPVLSLYATGEEIDQIRDLARELGRVLQLPLQKLWKTYSQKHRTGTSRRAFGKIPRRCVQPIIDELLIQLDEAENAPLTAVRLKTVRKTNRSADPKIDFNPEQVSQMLAEVGPQVSPELLAGPIGFYDVLQLKPLVQRSARGAAASVRYLDQQRFDLLCEFMKDAPTPAGFILWLIQAVPIGVREALFEGRKPRGWDVLGRNFRAND